eukprot:jgi/Chrzof1/5430/Cz16g02210.t1
MTSLRAMVLLLVKINALLCASLQVAFAAGCTNKHPYVGLVGKLTELEHKVSGTITILDDCSFRVTDFTYDGKAPAAYWWGAPDVDRLYQEGFALDSNRLKSSSNGVTVVIELSPGVTWDKVKVISVWCEAFAADFGHLELDKLQAEVQAAREDQRPAKISQAAPPTPVVNAPKPSSSDASRSPRPAGGLSSILCIVCWSIVVTGWCMDVLLDDCLHWKRDLSA